MAIGCAALGIWQLNRRTVRRAANATAVAGLSLPPVVDSTGISHLPPFRRAALTGRLDEAHEFVLRNRVIRGVPAVLIVTPLLRAGSDTAVLINRGYVPAPDANDPGAARWSEEGRSRFEGVLLPMPDRGDGDPVTHRGRETWRRLDLRAMRARLPYPVADVYLVAAPEATEGDAHTDRGKVYPFRAEPPPMDEGPHLMYAVQWFGIAAAVLAFGWLLAFRGTGTRVGE